MALHNEERRQLNAIKPAKKRKRKQKFIGPINLPVLGPSPQQKPSGMAAAGPPPLLPKVGDLVIQSKPQHKPRWRARNSQVVPQGQSPAQITSMADLTPIGVALREDANKDPGGLPATAPVYDAYDAGALYAQCLLDAAGTPQGVHIPEPGDTILCGCRKITGSTAVTIYNGTVGCDGSVAIITRGDPVSSWCPGAIDAKSDVTFTSWVSLGGSDLTSNQVTRPVILETFLCISTFGEPHTIRATVKVRPPSSAASSTTSLALNTLIGLTSAEQDLGGEEANYEGPCAIRCACYRTRGSVERRTWIGATTDRGTNAGETRVAYVYGLRSTDQAFLYYTLHYEELTTTPNVSPLTTSTISAVRANSNAEDLCNAASDGATRFAGATAASKEDIAMRAMQFTSPIRKLFDSERIWDYGERVITSIGNLLAGGGKGNIAGYLYKQMFPVSVNPRLCIVSSVDAPKTNAPPVLDGDERKGDCLPETTGPLFSPSPLNVQAAVSAGAVQAPLASCKTTQPVQSRLSSSMH